MNPDTRYTVAYIAGRLSSGASAGSVYDYEAGKHRMLTGDVTATLASASTTTSVVVTFQVRGVGTG